MLIFHGNFQPSPLVSSAWSDSRLPGSRVLTRPAPPPPPFPNKKYQKEWVDKGERKKKRRRETINNDNSDNNWLVWALKGALACTKFLDTAGEDCPDGDRAQVDRQRNRSYETRLKVIKFCPLRWDALLPHQSTDKSRSMSDITGKRRKQPLSPCPFLDLPHTT